MATNVSNILGKAENEFQSAVAKSGKADLGKDAFLQLLVAQLKHQDPLNPMDDKEFVAQLAQFTSLEQLMGINTGVTAMNDSFKQQQMMNAVSFIGKDVLATGDQISKIKDGVSKLYFSVGESINRGVINIFNASNELVRTEFIGAKQAGDYEYVWDGKDYQGNAMPDGLYKVAMAAENDKGKAVLVNTEVSGHVIGVETIDGTQYLRMQDGRSVQFLNVSVVVEPATNSGSGNGTGNGSGTGSGSDTGSGSGTGSGSDSGSGTDSGSGSAT